MSSTILETSRTATPAPVHTPSVPTKPITQRRVLRSEWLKLTTLRSTWISALAVLAAIIGFGVLAALISGGDVSPSGPSGSNARASDPVSTVLAGANLAVLLIAVVGGIVGAREYSTGMIRTTVAAVPRRLPVLWGKMLAFAGLFVPVVVGGVVIAFAAGMAVLHGSGAATASWSEAGVARAVFGSAVQIIGLGVLALALGVLLRSTAAAIGTVLGAVLFLPALAGALLPDSWNAVLEYLPSNAATAFTSVHPGDSLLHPGAGLVVFLLWVVAAVAAAAITLRTRDV